MEYSINNWPYKWFGVWNEYGEGYENYPSVQQFVNQSKNSEYNKALLEKYLLDGIIISASSRLNFPSPFDGEITGGSISFRTDGEWIWLDNITDFIKYNALAIPDEFYRHITANSFSIPAVSDAQLDSLQGPSL